MNLLPRLTAAAFVASALALPTVAATTSPAAAAVTHRVLITGDSITQGSSGDYTWRYRLWNKLASTAPGAASFVGTRTDLYDNVNQVYGSQHYATSFTAKAHSAKWGDTYINELSNIASQVTSSGANTLVVMLGSNDLAYHTSPSETVANVKTYVQRARAARPGIDVVIGEVVNRYDPWAASYVLTTETTDYAAKVRTLASSLNTSTERVVVASTRNGWDAKTHTWDGTHPNPTGEKLIAQRVSQGLASIGLGSSSPSITGTTAWNVAGPPVSLSPASEAAQLSWSRTSTGALSMFVEQRLTNIDGAWQRLPYAVNGNGWNAEILAAGGTYQFRVVPSKGWSTGTVGPTSSVTTTGPTPGSIETVSTDQSTGSLYGGKAVRAQWSTSSQASGYLVGSRAMSNNPLGWDDLPYTVATREWVLEPLAPGRRYIFRVTPVRGFLEGPQRSSSPRRTDGIAGNRIYVALGDSYSAGLGSSGAESSDGCFRAHDGWVQNMQSLFNGATYHLACSGAEIDGLSGLKSVRNQLPAMRAALENWGGRPELVTLTVGGNDVGFSDIIKSCLFGDCTGKESQAQTAIVNLGPKIRDLYADIRSSAPYADIVVGGYPAVLETTETGTGSGCSQISASERYMASRLSSSLNARITTAAGDAAVWSVGQRVWNAFAGHNACSSSAWIHAVNTDLGGEISGLVDNKSFHPNDGGQLTYARVFSDFISSQAAPN